MTISSASTSRCAQRVRLVAGEAQPRQVTEHPPRFVHRHRVVHPDRRATAQQFVHDHPTRRFAQVVGVRLEGQPPEGEAASLQILAKTGDDLVDQHPLQGIVRHLDRGQHAQVDARIVASWPVRTSALTSLGKHDPP